ncbi:hypothetical protein TRIUR3_19475 [Triticum urartu]|uniref:Uncharacterized protein n=1 Tax=Triticum urartu TaxID=4572 RepID=M8ARC1_TRIUA|nr:hypothetical protein TRIUR3_19475 [Triticum urartu]
MPPKKYVVPTPRRMPSPPLPRGSRGSRGCHRPSPRACLTLTGGRKFSAGRLSPPIGGTGPTPRRPGTVRRSRLRRCQSKRSAWPNKTRRLTRG